MGRVVAVDETETGEQGAEGDEGGGDDDFGADAVAEETHCGGGEGGDGEDEEDEGDLHGVVVEEKLDAEGEGGFETGEEDAMHDFCHHGGEHAGCGEEG